MPTSGTMNEKKKLTNVEYTFDGSILPVTQPSRSHAERCPVCQGKGVIKTISLTSACDDVKTCHGCGGSGWVVVPD